MQHRLVMLVMAGDDCGFQTKGLPVYPVCDQQRSGDPHREGYLGQCDEAKQLLISRGGAVRAVVDAHHRLDADGDHDNTDLQHDQLPCQAPPPRVHTHHRLSSSHASGAATGMSTVTTRNKRWPLG
jgi:hypothetical protein